MAAPTPLSNGLTCRTYHSTGGALRCDGKKVIGAGIAVALLGVVVSSAVGVMAGASSSSTEVGGVINADTKWTSPKSPLHRYLQRPGPARGDPDH